MAPIEPEPNAGESLVDETGRNHTAAELYPWARRGWARVEMVQNWCKTL